MSHKYHSTSVREFYEQLTKRELEILTLLAEGLKDREIGQELHLALKTVKWYNSRIYSKLNVRNRGEAVIQGEQLGLLDRTEAINPRHNLPVQTTSFVGRERELSDLLTLLNNRKVRLITILAPGGMGKTRLALEVAQKVLSNYPDGAFFVPLAPLTAYTQVLTTIVDVLNLHFSTDEEPIEQLKNYLRDRQILLIMDNFEHLLDAIPIINDILVTAPELNVIVTSREKLSLSGETVYAISGMNFPEWETTENALEYDAVKLFLQSADRLRTGFQLTADDLTLMARICYLTEGMPLALLLASSWIDVLSLEEIVTEIQASLDFLEVEIHDIPRRQWSIRAVFEPTWNRLREDEKKVFMKFAVFRGGCTREAAQTVTQATLRHLQIFVNKALLVRTTGGRYDIHELVRQYAKEKLEETADDRIAKDTHAKYFANFIAKREPDIKCHRQLKALDEIEIDFENVSTAWHRAIVQRRYKQINQMIDGLSLFCWLRGKGPSVLDLLQVAYTQLAPVDDKPEDIWMRVVSRYGQLQAFYSELSDDIQAQIEQKLQRAQSVGDRVQLAYFSLLLGDIILQSTDVFAAVSYLEESIIHYRHLDDKFYLAESLRRLGYLRHASGRRIEGVNLNKQSLSLQREIGDKIGMTWSLANLGTMALVSGHYNDIEEYLRETVALHPEVGDVPAVGFAMCGISLLTFLRGDYALARKQAEDLLIVFNNTYFALNIGYITIVLGLIATIKGDYAQGYNLIEQGRALVPNPVIIAIANWGLAMTLIGINDYAMAWQHIQESLRFSSNAGQEGLMMWCLPLAIFIHKHEERYESAVELTGLCYTHTACATGWLEQWELFTNLHSELRDQLGTEAFNRAWENCKQRDLATVVDQLLM